MTDSFFTRSFHRRTILKQGTLFLLAGAVNSVDPILGADTSDNLKVGLVTDMHYADKPTRGSRHYRETLDKLEAAAIHFEKAKPHFIVELGDFIDAADSVEVEQEYLKTINKQFVPICKERHYILGNHCVDTLTKEEFLSGVEQKKSYYSFDQKGIHFVVLDSCFRSDGKPYQRKNFQWTDANIPPAELEWLAGDLEDNDKPTIVFAHQRLDVSNNHGVRNCRKVREILEKSGNVKAVFQGHSHQNDLKEIGGIHYCTLVAMVEGSGEENSAYTMMTVAKNGSIAIEGFLKQKSYQW